MINTVAWVAAGLWLLLLARFWYTRRSKQLHPARIFAWSWAIMFFINALPLIEFPPVALNAWLYLVAFASMLVIGAGLGAKLKWSFNTKKPVEGLPRSDILQIRPQVYRFVKWFIILGAAALVLNLFIAYFTRGVDFLQSSAIRDVESQLLNRQIGNWKDRIIEFTLPIPWVCFIVLLLYSESFKLQMRWLVFVFGIGLFLYGVSTGGRTTMLRIILIFLVSLWVRHRQGLRPWPWKLNLVGVGVIGAACIAGLVYFMYAWVWRVGSLENLTVEVPKYHIDASASPALSWLLSEIPPSYRGLATYPPLYLTTEANNFGSTFNTVHIAPYWGFWQLSNLASAFHRLGFPVPTTVDIYTDVITTYADEGYFDSQWRTMAQEFILDFGRAGALVAAIIFGSVAGSVYQRYRQGKAYYSILLVILLSWSIYGAWTSPFNDSQLILFAYSFLYIFIVYLLRWKKPLAKITEPAVQALPAGENGALDQNADG